MRLFALLFLRRAPSLAISASGNEPSIYEFFKRKGDAILLTEKFSNPCFETKEIRHIDGGLRRFLALVILLQFHSLPQKFIIGSSQFSPELSMPMFASRSYLGTVLEFSDTIEQSSWERQYEQHPAPLHIRARKTASLFHRIVSRRVSRGSLDTTPWTRLLLRKFALADIKRLSAWRDSKGPKRFQEWQWPLLCDGISDANEMSAVARLGVTQSAPRDYWVQAKFCLHAIWALNMS
ncbi:hypothetical protein VNO77_03097 [Canavalia gladiata]|uniref:Uncharacterized protein n=1 Tax=Canavalia gladiata TaxID=3824 RepID=A0AAN9R6I3_CANGL